MHPRWFIVSMVLAAWQPGLVHGQTGAAEKLLTGTAAFGDWRTDEPGIRRRITPRDLPAPFASRSASNFGSLVRGPGNAQPKVPPGFAIRLFAEGLEGPRIIRTAPNGDIFVAESNAGRIRVLRPSVEGDSARQVEAFATGLNAPFGIAFHPGGPDPEWVYVANTDAVVRFAYRSGDLQARGRPEPVASIPGGRGHWTRDVAF